MRRAGIFTLTLLAPFLACKNGDRPNELTSSASAAELWSPARSAELYFSTEVSGFIEPCGCTTKPLGGIQRLATVLARGKKERVLIDAGNFILPSTGIDEITRPQHLLKSRILARAYRQLGAVAINLGESDLAEGVELIEDLQREGSVPFVSANVRPVGESGPAVARSFMRNVGGIRVGITGVATPEKFEHVKRVTAIEYAPTVRAEVSSLRKEGAELVVVLAHVGEVGARELAAAVPDIDIIIRAPGTPIERPPSAPERQGNVIIAESGSQGQHIGRITLSLGASAPERPIALDDSGAADASRRKLIEKKIRAYRTEADTWRVDPAKAEAVKARDEQIAKLEKDLASPVAQAARPQGPSVRIDLFPLGEEIPSDPEMSRLLGAYYGQLRELNLDKGDLSLCKHDEPAKAIYVGTERCAECHREAYAFWKKTKHASAWETLEDQGKHFDLTCIGCHTVGYQRPGGFCRLKDVGFLKDVGCESCHGPGSIHVDDSEPSSIVLATTADTCKSACHVSDHSDAFVYEKYLHEITGPGHALSQPKSGH